MKKIIGRLFLRIGGWQLDGALPDEKRLVVIAAPHTSNWDLPLMLAVSFAMGVKVSWMGKHTIFRPPFGWFMRALGGVPIERHKRSSVVEQMVDLFGQKERLALVVAVEGTRSRRETWKSGFYHIARDAEVPVLLSFLDYANKVGGLGPAIRMTGDVNADMDVIRAFYADKPGRFPELFAPPRMREEEPAD